MLRDEQKRRKYQFHCLWFEPEWVIFFFIYLSSKIYPYLIKTSTLAPTYHVGSCWPNELGSWIT